MPYVPIPVATDYVARASGTFELDFACRRCGFRSKATVQATSKGTSTGGPLGLGASSAAPKAAARAAQGLAQESRDVLGLARCPGCQQRSRGGRKGWWLVRGTQAIVLYAIFLAVPVLAFGALFGGHPSWRLVLGGLGLLPLYLVVAFALRLRDVDRRVSFVRAPEPDERFY